MDCHQCGACCTEISISSAIPGAPLGKPAGQRCLHLMDNNLCGLFNDPRRPAVCSSFQADLDICGTNYQQAVHRIRWYEKATKPGD